MSEAEPMKCYQHCDRTRNILCFSVLRSCPLCGRDTLTSESRIPPYVLPSPLVLARRHPLSIVIKPTTGTFLLNYTEKSNLHMGVTDSQGVTYDYDEDGVNINSPGWDQCVAIAMPTNPPTPDSTVKWDRTLAAFSRSDAWTKYRYHEEEYNCFDFVIQFLWTLGLHHGNHSLRNKTAMCEELVIKHTGRAGQYISLYRDIQRYGYVCQIVK